MEGKKPGSLWGRESERAVLERQLAKVRDGHSAVLVLRGEAGIGKSALLEYTADSADGCRVVRAAGVEAEMELAFGGLHQLCAPFLDHLGNLPDPQRTALETAFGLSAGTPRTGSSWDWRSSACSPTSLRRRRSSAWSTTCNGSIVSRPRSSGSSPGG